MSDIEVLGAFGLILGFFACLAAVIVIVAILHEVCADWWRGRHTEHDGHPELVERCNVYALRPRPVRVDEIRNRRGDAA